MLVLQRQAAKAHADLIELEKARDRARKDPEAFRDALKTGKIRTKADGLFNISLEDVEGSDGDGDPAEGKMETKNTGMGDSPEGAKNPSSSREQDGKFDERMPDSGQSAPSSTNRKSGKKATEKWPQIPARQNVVRAPAINWSQYAVVGESLDKLHEDQRKNPAEGVPRQITPDGRVNDVEGGKQRSAAIAAPYDPLKDRAADTAEKSEVDDKVEKPSTRKSGKG